MFLLDQSFIFNDTLRIAVSNPVSFLWFNEPPI